MRSDVIHVTNKGSGILDARAQAEKVGVFLELTKKETLHLSLLTEEMMGMMLALTGQVEADFWIESEDKKVSLHLKTQTLMNSEMRQKLLAASSTGKNVAVKGIMGKIKDIFQRLIEPVDDNALPTFALAQGMISDPGPIASFGTAYWSLNQYKETVKTEVKKEWDELEKSIVSKLADEVQIGIKNGQVEMIIIKSF